jgi:hypothetical protein
MNEGAPKRYSGVYPTQKQAIDAAREIVQRSSAGEIVVHGRDGSFRWREIHGLPILQKPRVKSDLGTANIRRAVTAAIRERLEGK